MTHRTFVYSAPIGLLVIALFWLSLGAAPQPAQAQEPPPRPTLTPQPPANQPPANQPPANQPGDDENDDDDDTETALATGRITGTIIDATTNAPAPGISVTVGDALVISDSNGNYDRSGLPAGNYTVALSLTLTQGEPLQQPITIELQPDATVVQHLTFRSRPAATPTARPAVESPVPTAAGTVPQRLPATGRETIAGTVPQTLPATGGEEANLTFWLAVSGSGLFVGAGMIYAARRRRQM